MRTLFSTLIICAIIASVLSTSVKAQGGSGGGTAGAPVIFLIFPSNNENPKPAVDYIAWYERLVEVSESGQSYKLIDATKHVDSSQKIFRHFALPGNTSTSGHPR